MFVFRPPQRPLSVDIRISPAFRSSGRAVANGCLYSGLARDRCATILRILSPYGRIWRMRSCALRILLAATISIALVILRVLCTLLILMRISLALGMTISAVRSVSARLLEVADRRMQGFFVLLGQILVRFDPVDKARMLGLEVLAERLFDLQRVLHFDVIEILVVDGE